MRKLLLSLSLLSVFALASCKDDPIDPVVEEPQIGAGSTFTIRHDIFEDTLWTSLAVSDSFVYTVETLDTSYAGMLDSVHFLTALEDTTIYRVDAHGNLAVYQPEIEIPTTGVSYPESWPVVPIASKETKITAFEDDTNTVIQGFPAIVHTSLYSGYIGDDSLTIGAKRYFVQKGFVARSVSVGVAGTVAFTDVTTEYWYAPALKSVVVRRQKAWSNHNQSPIPNGGETWTVVDFKY